MAGRREKKKKGGLKIVILLLIVIFVLIYIIASKVYTDYKKYDVALDPANTEMISVNIPAGSTTTSIAQILYDNGIIPDVKKFKMKSRLNGLDGTFQAGDYQFSPSMTTSEIMDLLQNGRKAEVSFTIPEGYTIKDTAEKLAEEGLRQILDRKYYTEMEYHGIRHIVMFGIAFSGRKVYVQVGEREKEKNPEK